ncbi:MAG TPA: hypothetical protein VF831_10460 [Anaerolineales bacterium]
MDKIHPGSMSAWQRWGGLYVTVLMLMLLAFFAYHQSKNTGFFTERFRLSEMVALYLPIIVSLVPPILRAIQGRRNPSRLVEAASTYFWRLDRSGCDAPFPLISPIWRTLSRSAGILLLRGSPMMWGDLYCCCKSW